MTATTGHGGPYASAAVTAARPVVLVRYRPGITGQAARIVHLVPLPTDGQAGAVSALCGALLSLATIETVTPGQGMPCRLCVVNHITSTAVTTEPPAANPDGADTAGGVTFQNWGWPVTRHRDQIRLSLHHDVSALTIPIPLCTTVTEILTQRRCAPPVLAHPYTPDHRIVLTGQRYGVTLPWPYQVHQVTGVLLLPPTVTPRGPITWVRPPGKDSLRLCREIDLFGALRTVLNNPPDDPPPGHHPPPKAWTGYPQPCDGNRWCSWVTSLSPGRTEHRPKERTRNRWKGVCIMGKHDPTRDGDVHPDTVKKLDPKDFEKSGQAPTDDNDNDDDD